MTGKYAAHSQMTCFGGAGLVFGVIQAHLVECPLKEIYHCQFSNGALTVRIVYISHFLFIIIIKTAPLANYSPCLTHDNLHSVYD